MRDSIEEFHRNPRHTSPNNIYSPYQKIGDSSKYPDKNRENLRIQGPPPLSSRRTHCFSQVFFPRPICPQMVGAILPNVALFQRYENDQMELPVREPGAPTWSHVAKHGRKVRRLEMIRDRELKAGWGGEVHFEDILISRNHPNIIDTCLCSNIERGIAMVNEWSTSSFQKHVLQFQNKTINSPFKRRSLKDGRNSRRSKHDNRQWNEWRQPRSRCLNWIFGGTHLVNQISFQICFLTFQWKFWPSKKYYVHSMFFIACLQIWEL